MDICNLMFGDPTEIDYILKNGIFTMYGCLYILEDQKRVLFNRVLDLGGHLL